MKKYFSDYPWEHERRIYLPCGVKAGVHVAYVDCSHQDGQGFYQVAAWP